MIRLGDSSWVLVSDMGDKTWQGGGFNLVDIRSRKARPLVPDFKSPASAPFKECAPPEPRQFSAHGISAEPTGGGAFRVLAVNHGGRHSVELFDLRLGEDTARMTWVGCAVVPGGLSPNAVASLPGGGFVVTVPNARSPNDPPGEPHGALLEWSPGLGWSMVPGGELGGDNGVLASRDGRWLYISAYGEGAVYKLSRGPIPYARRRTALNFMPDNLRFSPNGSLLVTGSTSMSVDAMRRACAAAYPDACPTPTAVAKVDPTTLEAQLVFIDQGGPEFGAGSTAIVVDKELWLSSFQGKAVATVPLRDLGDPEL